MTPNDENLIQALQHKNADAFKCIVADYSEDMIIVAFLIPFDREKSSELVCNVLFNLFDDGFSNAAVPIHPFLYREVRAACYSYLHDIEPTYLIIGREKAMLFFNGQLN